MKFQNTAWLVATTLIVAANAMPENASAGPERDARRSERMIRACVADIGRNVEYPRAGEVLHRVVDIRQKNFVETEFRIVTAITDPDAEGSTRRYNVRCVTGALDQVVELRLRESAQSGV